MYLGIDVGTSSVKSVLIDASQRIVASASEALTVDRPRPGWSEQNPGDWWQATRDTLDRLAAGHPAQIAAVAGIGLSGQMHGATLLDGTDQVLRPAILWNDGRCAAECLELDAAADFRGIGGNLVMPGFTAPKLAWVARHEPEVFRRIARILLPKDYVRLALTGDHVSDMSDAAGTLWLDVARRDWSDELLAASGLDRTMMPRLVEGSEPSGRLRADLAGRWHMSAPPVVAGGGGDNAAAACGVGVLAPGSAFVSLGTSGVLFVSNARFSPNTAGAVHAFCHAAPNIWHQMGVILSATDSLEWLSSIAGAPVEALMSELERDRAPPGEALFLPYLSGERTPHNDAAARAAFVGLARVHTRPHLTQTVLEGVAYAFRDCLAALNQAGTDIETAFAVGGGARSRHWLTILASVLDRPLAVPGDGDFGAAFGAARLGMCAAQGADPLEVCRPPVVDDEIVPDPLLRDAYAAGYDRYRALYPSLKEAMS
jgi:xylulokinase